jgi:hypothetical protein
MNKVVSKNVCGICRIFAHLPNGDPIPNTEQVFRCCKNNFLDKMDAWKRVTGDFSLETLTKEVSFANDHL